MSKPQKNPRKKRVNGYQMPEPIPKDEILTDVGKKQWRIGPSIGKGGFGEIYSAQEASKSGSTFPYVIKIEPHENGPLFVEQHFYMKCGKLSDINAFKAKNKLKTFGMPAYLGSGSHTINDTKYRFLVIEKFDKDIDKLWASCKRTLPEATVFQLAWQITYVLEYIHEMGYIHADIKGANILLGCTGITAKQAYLVDFGLATKYNADKDFKPNPKKAHDGTIEYLSRDAHLGVPTRRGDFEILCYNIIHWLGGKLPWQSQLTDPKKVQEKKEEAMADVPKFLKFAFADSPPPDGVVELLKYVNSLEYSDEPNYKKIRSVFEKEIKNAGGEVGIVNFDSLKPASSKRKSVSSNNSPEKKVKLTKPNKASVPKKTKKLAKTTVDELEPDEEIVLTPAMRDIMAKKQNKIKENITTRKKKPIVEEDEISLNASVDSMEGFNDEMKEIKNRLKTEKKNKNPKKVHDVQNNTNKENGVGRSRRNLPTVNYSETISPSRK